MPVSETSSTAAMPCRILPAHSAAAVASSTENNNSPSCILTACKKLTLPELLGVTTNVAFLPNSPRNELVKVMKNMEP